jgi:hypothetical protein
MRRKLIREIKFPKPVYSLSFLNEEGVILGGHQGKVSMVSCEDYNLSKKYICYFNLFIFKLFLSSINI